MKKIVTISALCFVLFSTFAQQATPPTIEEIYAKYTAAIGDSGKIKNITNRLDVSSISTEYMTSGAVSNQGSSKQEVINFWDFANAQFATINKQFPSELTGDKITFARYLTANGKTTVILPDGKKTESTAMYNEYQENPFPEWTIPVGAKLLPNETFSGKEVYVVNYEKSLIGTPFNHFAYFDMESGLLIGSKVIKKDESLGSTTTSINMYEEYKEVDGLLMPHTTKMSMNQEMTGAVNMTMVSNITIKLIAAEFNIDAEGFKTGCFQNPEACFDKYQAK